VYRLTDPADVYNNSIRISLGGHSEQGILAFIAQLHWAAKIMRHIVGEEMDLVLS
jgi:hypothetical protein